MLIILILGTMIGTIVAMSAAKAFMKLMKHALTIVGAMVIIVAVMAIIINSM